jgi:hypothetical protein
MSQAAQFLTAVVMEDRRNPDRNFLNLAPNNKSQGLCSQPSRLG